MNEHLDPGYAAAADLRTRGHVKRDRVPHLIWILIGALAVGTVFGVAASRAAGSAPDDEARRADTLSAVREVEGRADALDVTRSELNAQVDRARVDALTRNSAGKELVENLGRAERAAGLDSVHGPGVTVTIAEPAVRSDLSDRARSSARSSAAVLDRDLQSVVNSLWVSGAEAVAVSGVRVGPSVTIRQAGGAMLVDNRPVPAPYAISAIGPPRLLETRFTVSDAYLRMTTVAQLYGVGFTITDADDMSLPAAALREGGSAQEVAGQ